MNGPQLPLALAATDSTAIQFRWCGPALMEGRAALVIGSDDEALPTFSRTMIREPAGCNPDPSLLAAYSFEGSGAQILDITGNGFDGILQNPAQRNPAGRFGAALEFGGNGGHVDLGTGLELAGNQLTIALWINADDFGITQARFAARAVGRNEQQQYWQVGTAGPNGNRIRFRVRTDQGATTTLESGPILQPNVWTHVAATYDGSQMTIYRDGSATASIPKSGNIDAEPGIDVWIGDSPPNGTRSFDGRIDELRIYERSLSSQEIQQIMDAPLTPLPSGP